MSENVSELERIARLVREDTARIAKQEQRIRELECKSYDDTLAVERALLQRMRDVQNTRYQHLRQELGSAVPYSPTVG